jgi:glucan phosphoethanolaminetransferase (alkaline phosphatase superfamily)
MVDSLRADHMQVYGYERPTTPFLSSLLKAGRLKKVEVATSNCADTNCGVSATLSSKSFGSQIPQNFSLQDLLHDQGYDVYFILSGSHRWYRLKDSYGTSLTYYFDGTNSARHDWNDDRVIFEGLENVPDSIGSPKFFYFHLMSTHSTGIRQEKYLDYRPAKNWIEFNGGEFDTASVTNYYDNGVVQADAIIKEVFESLKQKGYLDNSLVVILGDHGEALGQPDHSIYGHVNYLYQECIRIPLLIYDDEAKYANLEYATQIDVAPTILDRLGLAIPSTWQGQSLLAPNIERYSFHQTATSYPSYAVIYRTDRAIYKYVDHYALGEAFYELVSDPRETHNLIDTADPAIVEHLREKLAESLANP